MQQTNKALAVRLAFLVLLSLFLHGCKFFTMNPITVETVSPGAAVVDTSAVTKIDVYFSADANKTLAEGAFSLLEDGVAMDGHFEWPESKHLVFYPFAALKQTPVYTIRVSTTAEDKNGNSLETEFTHVFRGTGDSQRPSLSAITPLAYSRLALSRPVIQFIFSKPMNTTTVLDGFSISPDTEGYFVESTDKKTFQYVLTKDLVWRTLYTMTIPDSVRDLAGNTMGKIQKSTFFIGDESVKPAILSVTEGIAQAPVPPDSLTDGTETVTSGLEKDASISIQFSEAMNQDTVKNLLSFTPSLACTAEWNATGDRVTITHTDFFKYNIVYCMTVGKGCSDVQGNEMPSGVCYKINANGPQSTPPAVLGVDFLNVFDALETPTATVPLNHLQSIAYADVYNTKEVTGFFDICIKTANNASIDSIDFLNSFSVTAANASITPKGCQIDGNITFMAGTVPVNAGLPLAPNVHVIRYIVAIDNSSASYKYIPGYIQVSLDASFADSLKNTLGSTWSMRVNTTN